MKHVSFEEIGAVVATFACNGLIDGGKVVKLSGNGEVATCMADDVFCGVALADSTDYVGVQVKGFVTVNYAGTSEALPLGYNALVADATGGIAVKAGGVTCLVVSVDIATKTATIYL